MAGIGSELGEMWPALEERRMAQELEMRGVHMQMFVLLWDTA